MPSRALFLCLLINTTQLLAQPPVTSDASASIALAAGELEDAARDAERTIRMFDYAGRSKDPALLPSLRVLATVRFEQGKIGRAREAFARMRALPGGRPEQQAAIHAFSAALLEVEGRPHDAEVEYSTALSEWQRCGRGESADAGALLTVLGSLYVKQRRYDEAAKALEHALTIFDSSTDAVVMDRVKALNARAALYARRGQWRDARKDLEQALSIAGPELRNNPAAFVSIATGYARVLRKTHDRKAARSIEAYVAAIRNALGAGSVVDISELRTTGKR